MPQISKMNEQLFYSATNKENHEIINLSSSKQLKK